MFRLHNGTRVRIEPAPAEPGDSPWFVFWRTRRRRKIETRVVLSQQAALEFVVALA